MRAFVTLQEAQQAAEKVYGGLSSIPGGWVIDPTLGLRGELTSQNGSYVYALKAQGIDDGRRMLVFRGTEVTVTNVRDLFADVTDIGKTQFNELRDDVNQWL